MSDPSVTQFFTKQRHAKRMSVLFFALFVVVVLSHALVVFVFSAALAWVITGAVTLSWWLGALVFLALYLLFSMAVQKRRIKHGGQSLATKLGAVRLFLDNSKSGMPPAFFSRFIRVNHISELPSSYQRYYEFAEQMSLASGIAVPKLYVLPQQMSINALVAGFDAHDTVMIMTQGALERLDNDSLYALIAHEFGHILHGDAELNLRLYVMMAGLSLFYEAAEWLECVLLGEFHAGYHSQLVAQRFGAHESGVSFSHRDEWIRYWQSFGPSKRHQDNHTLQDADAVALLLKLPIIFALVVARLLGALGMASSEWMKQQFNQQREYLADATSMQLTRSLGMLSLLHSIADQDTSLVGLKVSAIDYFFFADPKKDDEHHWFASHPAPSRRLQAIHAHTYDDFGIMMTAHMDKAHLDEQRLSAAQHAPVHRLADELVVLNDNATTALDYEAFEEVVVDGRLVVSPAWHDGWQVEQDDVSSELLYPWRNQAHALATVQTSRRESGQRSLVSVLSDADIDTALSETQQAFTLASLPWVLTEQLQAPTGVLMVIEAVLVCRHQMVDTKKPFDFHDIFIALPTQDCANEPPIQQAIHHPSLLPHTITAKVLKAVSLLSRSNDHDMLMALLNLLSAQISAGVKDAKMAATLTRYAQGLEALCTCVPTLTFITIKQLNQAHILSKLPKLHQALVLAALQRVLLPNHAACQQKAKVTLKALRLDALLLQVDDGVAVLLVLLAFLAGVQDNSLLMARHDRVLAAVRRWWQLLAIDTHKLSDEMLIAFILRTHALGVQGWAQLFSCWQALDAHTMRRFQDSLHTALLYDGEISVREQCVWQLTAWLLTPKDGHVAQSVDGDLSLVFS